MCFLGLLLQNDYFFEKIYFRAVELVSYRHPQNGVSIGF